MKTFIKVFLASMFLLTSAAHSMAVKCDMEFEGPTEVVWDEAESDFFNPMDDGPIKSEIQTLNFKIQVITELYNTVKNEASTKLVFLDQTGSMFIQTKMKYQVGSNLDHLIWRSQIPYPKQVLGKDENNKLRQITAKLLTFDCRFE